MLRSAQVIVRTVAVLGVAATCVGCGLPFPGGEGTASQEGREQSPEAQAGTPEGAAAALVEAWSRRDRADADRLSDTEAERALFKRSYPDPPPQLVNCQPATRTGGEAVCIFVTGNHSFTMQLLQSERHDLWKVRSVKFTPG